MTRPNLGDSNISPRLFKWQRNIPALVRYLLVVAVYLLVWTALDVAAMHFELAPEVQIWYPPSALDVVLLLVRGLRYWPALWLNTWVHEWFVTKRGLPLVTLLSFDLITTLGYTAACAVLLFNLRINPRLRQLRDAVWFIVIAAFVAPLIIAIVQSLNFATVGIISWSDWLLNTLRYWAGDSTGIGMLAPFLLILLRQIPWVWAHREPKQQAGSEDELRWPSRLGLLVLLGHIMLLGGGIWFAFGAPRGVNLDYTYCVFLPLIWIALQYGFPRAATTVLGINVGVAFLAGSRIGAANKLVLQFGLMAITFTGLILGAISSDRKHKESKLQRLYREVQSLNIDLERQVQERTAQLQEQMQQLQQLNQLKDDFLSTVSHELRTPLTNIKMAIQMLQIANTSERRDRYLKILQHECDREATLINDLLDLQRLESGADPIAVETIELIEWLPPIVAAFHERAIARQQTLNLDIAPGLSPLTSEPTKLKRILTELLNNACKYTPPAGSITVTVRALASDAEVKASDGVELVVSNYGSEIPATELTRIFEKFYRIPKSDRWQQGGTGLGLAIVRKLVEQLGGQIRVSSQAMQTSFTVELPSLDAYDEPTSV